MVRILFLLLSVLLAGCAADPWWKTLETATNKNCLEYVKAMTCREFLDANARIRPGIFQASQIADPAPIEALNGHSEQWLFQQMVQDLDQSAVALKDLPECKRTP